MNRRKLDKLKREHASFYRSQRKAYDLQQLAQRLGRRPVKRGKEPVWETELDGCFPLSIPDHGGRDLAPGTKRSILDQLEDDILAWEALIDDEDDDRQDDGDEEEL
jgi:hypothetical protein